MDKLVEYPDGSAFPGKIGRSVEDSTPAWPAPLRARDDSPNVMFIVMDDMGFGHLGCYGSPISTPNIDRLAAGGLRYTNMHTTALCSPSRSCIMTGRNHHSNAMAAITEASTGYPGYNGAVPFENGMLSEILIAKGYNTYALGKWHLVPTEEMSAAGPYSRWPLGRGFERYYGFLGGDTHQYYPDLISDNHQVEPEKTPAEGYHLTEDLADRAIGFVADAKQVAPTKPFFLYFAPGATHAPHQVPKEWIDKYAGKFDGGWSAYREHVLARQKELGIMPSDAELSRHDPDVQDWETLSADEKRLYARMMEVFAGFLEHADHQIGRVLDFLESLGELDNTLVMLISDNGASAEGGPTGSINENKFFNFVPDSLEQNLAAIDELGGPKHFNHYPWGWTWAGNTPFRRWKRETYRGGISDPFIVHWPNGIAARGELRHQFGHAIDMVPTVLEALNIDPPAALRGVTQSPIEGTSLTYSFDDAEAADKHTTQYFEMLGHRSIYHDGWRAVCPWPGPSFAEGHPFGTPMSRDELDKLDVHGWELYHIAEDPTENHNLAADNQVKLIELITLWYAEAGKYDVLPIDGSGQQRFGQPRPQLSPARESYTYYPNTQMIPANAAVSVINRPHTILAELVVPEGGAEGVIMSHGGNAGGYSVYVADGKLHWAHNYVAVQIFDIESTTTIPTGNVTVEVQFTPTGKPDIIHGKGVPATVQFRINGEEAGSGDVPVTVPLMFALGEGVSIGRDSASPVTDAYGEDNAFTGTIRKVIIDVSGEQSRNMEAEARAYLARQ